MDSRYGDTPWSTCARTQMFLMFLGLRCRAEMASGLTAGIVAARLGDKDRTRRGHSLSADESQPRVVQRACPTP